MISKNTLTSILAWLIISAGIGGIILLLGSISYLSVEHTEFCVQEKQVMTSGGGKNSSVHSKYLIFTDKGVYENGDSIWFWKFNSSDVYGQLKVNQCFKAKTNWFRVPFLSMYQNIIKVEQIERP